VPVVSSVIAPLSRSYVDARAAFLEAAAAAGARIESHPHPLRGVDGEALFVDVAEVGPADADHMIVVVSGTHGVEGYLGSALQRHHLGTLDPDRTGGPTLVFVHALNPYGFSWVRRVNEDNVDLNRNFVDWSQPPPANPDYADLADILVPTSWTAEVQEQHGARADGQARRAGHAAKLQQIIQGGQFDHPTGVFYGGTGPTWSHRWLREFTARRLAGVSRAAIIDLHTGLGPWGARFAAQQRSAEQRGVRPAGGVVADVTGLDADDSVSAVVAGDWLAAAHGFAPDTEITGICIEYGTVDGISVLQSVRADAVLHSSGDPTAASASDVRAQVRAAFLDDDPAWLETCWPRYQFVATAALERLS
jgi:hypothetical protein